MSEPAPAEQAASDPGPPARRPNALGLEESLPTTVQSASPPITPKAEAGEGRGDRAHTTHAAHPTFAEALAQLHAAHRRELEGLQKELRRTNRKITRMAQTPTDERSKDRVEGLRQQGNASVDGQGAATKDTLVEEAWVPGSLPTAQEREHEGAAEKSKVQLVSATPPPHDGKGWEKSPVSDQASDDSSEDESRRVSWTGWDPRDFGIQWNPFADGEKAMSNFVQRYIGPKGEEVRKRRTAYKIVRSMPFSAASYIAIILNSLFMGVIMQNQMNAAVEGKVYSEAWSDAIELTFVVFFTIELFMKVLAEDYYLLFSSDWTWNLLDAILVGAALLQWIIDMFYDGDTPNISISRTIRLFRITRVLRVTRVLRAVQSLRVMIFAIFKSLGILCWVLAVLLFFKYIFAMFFMYGTIQYIEMVNDGNGGALTDDEYSYLKDGFDNIITAIVTLFECITGGRDWGEVYHALVKISLIYGVCFLVYIYFMVFLVLNVVIGTVVDVTSGVAARDRDRMVEDEMKALKDYASDIKDFFRQADADGSGQLSWEEFRTHLADNRVKAYFQTLDLDIRQAHVLFKLLDCNDNDEVGIDEFLDGCLRLKGQAKSLDLHLVIYQLERLIKGSTMIYGDILEPSKKATTKSTVHTPSTHTKLS